MAAWPDERGDSEAGRTHAQMARGSRQHAGMHQGRQLRGASCAEHGRGNRAAGRQ